MKPIGYQYGDSVFVRAGRTIVAVLVPLLVMTSAFTACSQQVTLPDDADAEIILGHEVYGARCARCHGADGGGGIGPSLREVETRLDDDQQATILRNGRKSMPRFDSVLSSEEIDAVIRYSREIL